MENLTDFTDTSDVSDAAIEWVLRAAGSPGWGPDSVRKDAALGGGYPADCARILAARLIQRHHPDLLVDPVDALIDEQLAEDFEVRGLHFVAQAQRNGARRSFPDTILAKRLYLMGIEKGKQS